MRPLALCVAALLCVGLASAHDKGFNLLFTSNRREYSDEKIQFEKPIPDWIDGTLFHNGLGTFEQGNRKVVHFFDAFAKANSIKLKGGSKEALFSTKFLNTGIYNETIEINDISPYMLFDQPNPKFKLTERITQFKRGMDNTNVNLLQFGPDLVAVSDMPRLYTVDGDSLATGERVDPEIPNIGIAKNSWLSSAHPVPEAGTNNWLSIVTEVTGIEGKTRLHVVRTISAKKRGLIKSIDFTDKVPYMHDYAGTENYLVLFVNPINFDFLTYVTTGSPMKAMTFDKNQLTDVYVLEIATGKLQVLKTETFFGLHHGNAYEVRDKDGRVSIVSDIITYADLEVMKQQLISNLLDPEKRNDILGHTATLKRYTIDLTDGVVKVQTFPHKAGLDHVNHFDFPTFNENYRFKKYCILYGVAQKMDKANFTKWALTKKDMCDVQGDKSWYKENHYPGEPWFVATPGATKEDDGLIFSQILDGENNSTYVGIFDAQSLEMVNKAYLPTFLPFIIHGRFMPSKTT